MTKEELRNLVGMDLRMRSAAESDKYRMLMREHSLDPNSYYQKMEMSSPYVNTHRDITYHYEAMSLHSHAFYEIVCCRSSCGAEYLVGPHRYSLQKGDIILIRPGVSHCAILPNPLSIPYERDIIWLSESFLNTFLKILDLPPVSYETELPTYLLRTADTPWEFLWDMIHSGVQEEAKKQDAWQTNVIGNTLQVLSYLRRAYFSQTAQPLKAEKPDLLDGIIAYIETNYSEKLTMTELSKLFYISERTISSLFRNRLGVTFYQFLTRRRLIAAKDMILKRIPLEAVGEQTGFGDYSAFYRAFKSEFGISPLDFKKLEEQKLETAFSAVSNER